MSQPIRVQRKRVKGYRMPDNTVSVCRPGRYGNPYTLAHFYASHNAVSAAEQARWRPDFNGAARDAFEVLIRVQKLADPDRHAAWIAPLRGKNLACFCPLSAPCHGDVLLRFANLDNASI